MLKQSEPHFNYSQKLKLIISIEEVRTRFCDISSSIWHWSVFATKELLRDVVQCETVLYESITCIVFKTIDSDKMKPQFEWNDIKKHF